MRYFWETGSHFLVSAIHSHKLFLTSSISHIFGTFCMIVFCLWKPYHWEKWICMKPRGHLVTSILSLSTLPSFKLDDCPFDIKSEHQRVLIYIHAPAFWRWHHTCVIHAWNFFQEHLLFTTVNFSEKTKFGIHDQLRVKCTCRFVKFIRARAYRFTFECHTYTSG